MSAHRGKRGGVRCIALPAQDSRRGLIVDLRSTRRAQGLCEVDPERGRGLSGVGCVRNIPGSRATLTGKGRELSSFIGRR